MIQPADLAHLCAREREAFAAACELQYLFERVAEAWRGADHALAGQADVCALRYRLAAERIFGQTALDDSSMGSPLVDELVRFCPPLKYRRSELAILRAAFNALAGLYTAYLGVLRGFCELTLR